MTDELKAEYVGEILIGKDISDEQMLELTISTFENKWRMSHDYRRAAPTVFESFPLDFEIKSNTEFMSFVCYLAFLNESMVTGKHSAMDEWLRKEVVEWDRRGGLCIYTSVLLWCLIRENNIVADSELKYIQGLYNHPTNHSVMATIDNITNHTGLHAFITLKGAVVDFSIIQEGYVFNLGDYPFIIGEIPSEMILNGWTESEDIVKQYAREIAGFSGMTYHEWIAKHNKYAYETLLTELSKNEA